MNLYVVILAGGCATGDPSCLGVFTTLKAARKCMRDEFTSLVATRDTAGEHEIFDWNAYYADGDIDTCFEIKIQKVKADIPPVK